MKTLEHQLAEYCEFQEELHPRITADEVAGSPIRVSTPVRVSTGIWWASAVAAVVVLMIGGVGLLSSQRLSDERTAEPTTATVAAEVLDAQATAESFAKARSNGDTAAAVALVAEDANIDIGPATSRSDLEAEMRWQEATGLALTFDRCEPADGAPVHGDAGFSCFVTWTGSVASSLGYGADTFEYTIEIAQDMIVSAVLINLGSYGDTTWKPFRDWMEQSHPSEMALIYTAGWHAVLTDESIELWRQRTAEFVVEQSSPATTPTEEPDIVGFIETGRLDVTWIEHTGRDGTQPYGIDSYDAGVYTTVGEDGRYTSDDAVGWTFEAAAEGTMFPDEVSEDGQWGMAKDFFTGTLLRDVDGDWQVAPRPPQAQQSGEWGWMRYLESSGDVLMVLGGPAEPGSDGYPAEETAAYWRIEGSGEWQKTTLDWDYSNGNIRSVPAGGFAYYNVTEGTVHTSEDGVQWAEGVSTDHPYWKSGDGVFPDLVYAETAGQFWTSADLITWTYEFTGPPGGDYGLHLNRTNLGIVATRVTQIPGDGSNSDTSIDSWLLDKDRQSWSALTSFSIGALSYGAVNHGAAGNLVWLSVTGGEEPTLTPQNRLWIAQLSSR